MTTPFIRPYEYNFIRTQADNLSRQLAAVHDPDIREAVIYSASKKVFDLIPAMTPEQEELLMRIKTIESEEELTDYLADVAKAVHGFPVVTEAELKKMFHKNKKLKLPDLARLDAEATTFLSWNDTGSAKKFFVYPLDGKMVGVEGRYVPSTQKGICSLCNNYSDVTLVSARRKGSSDSYKAIGNYMCIDSDECNRHMTDPSSLEHFLNRVK